jgi:hypothetical protein
MEETSVVTLLLELADSSGTWKALVVGSLILAWRWWKSVSQHLCQAIPDALAIARNVTEDGLDIRLKVHMCEDKEEEK